MKLTRKPTHPGTILKEDYLLPLKLSITTLSALLGVSRKTLSKIINNKSRVSPNMALRLSRAFDTSPNLWLNLQKKYDLWEAEKERFEALEDLSAVSEWLLKSKPVYEHENNENSKTK